jgi:hypothetical protein
VRHAGLIFIYFGVPVGISEVLSCRGKWGKKIITTTLVNYN